MDAAPNLAGLPFRKPRQPAPSDVYSVASGHQVSVTTFAAAIDMHVARLPIEGWTYVGGEVPAMVTPPKALEETFQRLADQWRRETAHESSERRRITHPAYKAIIDLKWPAVPILLRRLRQDGADWFAALRIITGDNVTAGKTSSEDAVGAWLDWGIRRGYF